MNFFEVPGTVRPRLPYTTPNKIVGNLLKPSTELKKNVLMIEEVTDIAQIEGEIIDEFSLFDDFWMDKYEHIIGLGKELR